jgi:hypothetical protein
LLPYGIFNGDVEMNLPFYPLKSQTKIENKVHTNPKNVDKILFHQGLIKILVMYELNEFEVSWKQLLCSLGFEEQVIKTPEKLLTKKPEF